jgi:hypothetical protein
MTNTASTETTSAFQVGATYSCRSLCDYDCIWTFEVIKRTAKFVTLRQVNSGEIMRVGVKTWNGDEVALPFGSYSMAPSIRASKEVW